MPRMRYLAAAGLALSAGAALAAGPFDGTYKGGSGRTCSMPTTQVTVTVADNVASGSSAWPNGSVPIRGRISADGSFHGTIGGGPLEGKVSGSKMALAYASSGGGANATSQGCRREIELERQN